MPVSPKQAVMMSKPPSSPAIISDTLLEVPQKQHLSNLSSSDQSHICATENGGKGKSHSQPTQGHQACSYKPWQAA